MSKSYKIWLGISFAHLLLALSATVYAFAATVATFDTGAPASFSARLAGIVASAFMFPASLLWTRWASENLPNILEWLLLAMNSLAWGALISFIVLRATRLELPRA